MNAREKILEALTQKGEPMTSRELSEATGSPLSTIYFNTTILVYGGKIRRYAGISGIFELVKEEKK